MTHVSNWIADVSRNLTAAAHAISHQLLNGHHIKISWKLWVASRDPHYSLCQSHKRRCGRNETFPFLCEFRTNCSRLSGVSLTIDHGIPIVGMIWGCCNKWGRGWGSLGGTWIFKPQTKATINVSNLNDFLSSGRYSILRVFSSLSWYIAEFYTDK